MVRRNGQVKFTPTEKRMWDLLADGLPHSRWELRESLYDELGDVTNIRTHISKLRHKLPDGEAILCEIYKRTVHYRRVKLLSTGKR
mgnify:CR=1 FL=1